MIKYLIPLLFILNSCGDSSSLKTTITKEKIILKEDTPSEVEISKIEPTESAFTHLVTFEEGTGYGYQIFENDHLLINQAHIPAIQGVNGFSSEEKAETTALYILKQIKEGNFPPTITKEKLLELDVL